LQSPLIYAEIQVSNIGDYYENVNVGLTATNKTNIVFPSQLIGLGPGSGQIVTFTWNTTTSPTGRYALTFTASIPVVPPGNAPDGSLTLRNRVRLLPLGDIDQNGVVAITDVSVIFYNYGFTCYSPSTCSPRYSYNFYADIAGHGVIDVVDVGIVAKNYGLTG
jgi:hypothetical protein